MEQQEIWKDIEGYDGKYQVSNMGRVRSNRGTRARGWLELRPSPNAYNQPRVTLYKGDTPKPAMVARLVAMAFIQSDIEEFNVRHHDADPMNNRCDNLFLLPRRNQFNKKQDTIVCKDLPGERWKPIKSLDGRFAVSNMGRVKNIWQRRRNPILHQGTTRTGYKFIVVTINGQDIVRLVHRLVAYHFCRKPADLQEQSNRYYQVNHKDENPANNRADNLEWVTCKENINYGHHNERVAKALGTEVWQYDIGGNLVEKFISIASAARSIGKKNAETKIKECLAGDTAKAKAYGYYWRMPNQPLQLNHTARQLSLF